MNVCDECGVNTELLRGHSRVCSQYEKPLFSDAEMDALRGVDTDTSKKIRDFSDALNDVVISRGEKTVLAYLATIDITDADPGFPEMMLLAHMCIAVGAGITVQVLLEQDIIDQQELRRAAGV